jgi:ABC-type Fe3+-hydroxamate transport system substrate-binding protein
LKFTDQLHRTIEISFPPERIISLVPSQTELLFDLGLDEKVTGITKFCIHPDEWYRSKTRVGGTKELNISQIRALKPDLIIANKEENEKAQLELLMNEFPVWISEVKTLDDARKMISAVGALTGSGAVAERIIAGIDHNFDAVLLKHFKNRSAVYLIWNEPMMCAGNDTFINDMMERAGFTNIIKGRYPEITQEEIAALKPEYILLSSEPFPFKEKHRAGMSKAFPFSRVILVDGEYFSWYGSRLIDAPAYFNILNRSL